MPTHKQLIKRAKRMGHEITPTLNAELLMLASVSDADIKRVYKPAVVKKLARDFRVPVVFAEARIGDAIPPLRFKRARSG